MSLNIRFADQHKTLADFYKEVWVQCPSCNNLAIARALPEQFLVRLNCTYCSLLKEVSTRIVIAGVEANSVTAAHWYFNAELWLQAPFKNEVFWVYNPNHLYYLEAYIGAKLREHKDREHFTLLEKLPKFYHEAKNRNALLKLIEKLKGRI